MLLHVRQSAYVPERLIIFELKLLCKRKAFTAIESISPLASFVLMNTRPMAHLFGPAPAPPAAFVAITMIVMMAPLHNVAQDYPVKPIRLVVPYAPGGGMDLLMRPVAQRLVQILGQPVVVDNRAGATGIMGADAVAKAQPDGYTILAAFASHYLQKFVTKNEPYDAVNDFVPVTQVARSPNMIVLHPSVPAQNVTELVLP
jgi:tripartite-type tricarboxylate transporter receptor subunit TctC